MDAAIVSWPGRRSADRGGEGQRDMTSPIRRWRARADADATVASTTIAIIRWIDPLSKHQHQPGAIFIVLLPSRMGGADAVTCAGGRTYRTYVRFAICCWGSRLARGLAKQRARSNLKIGLANQDARTLARTSVRTLARTLSPRSEESLRRSELCSAGLATPG